MSPVVRRLTVVVIAGASLLSGPVPPASACGGVECMVRCVRDFVAHQTCRL